MRSTDDPTAPPPGPPHPPPPLPPRSAASAWRHLLVRPRMAVAVLLGVAVYPLLPAEHRWISRALVAWDVGVWAYLLMMAWMMLRADHGLLRRHAAAQAQSAPVVLGLVVLATLASLVAIVVELAAVRTGNLAQGTFHGLLAAWTVLGAWLLLPLVFTLSYASHHYHAQQHPCGLLFPEDAPGFQPHYSDFLYFAFTIAVAAQTSDVQVTTRRMRRLVLLQTVLSFFFNTAVLALLVNMAAGLV